MRDITVDVHVFEAEIEQRTHIGIEAQAGQCMGFPLQLLAGLIEMIEIQMRITQRVHKVADFQITHLRHHVGKQCVAGNVERQAEEDVRRTLVELARQPAIGDMELEHGVAGLQGHLLEFADVPSADQQAPRIRVALDLAKQPADLVDAAETLEQLEKNNQEAAERGVFGAPSFLLGESLFFGNDRLDFVREQLAEA